MTTAGELLVDVLGDATSVTDIVSTRISVGYREQGDAMPCVVIDIEDIDSIQSLTGESALDIVTASIDCIDAKYADSVTLADAVLGALEGTSGTYELKTYSMSASRSAATISASPDGGYVVTYPILINLYLEP